MAESPASNIQIDNGIAPAGMQEKEVEIGGTHLMGERYNSDDLGDIQKRIADDDVNRARKQVCISSSRFPRRLVF
jgi:hypothetical protein